MKSGLTVVVPVIVRSQSLQSKAVNSSGSLDVSWRLVLLAPAVKRYEMRWDWDACLWSTLFGRRRMAADPVGPILPNIYWAWSRTLRPISNKFGQSWAPKGPASTCWRCEVCVCVCEAGTELLLDEEYPSEHGSRYFKISLYYKSIKVLRPRK